MMTHAQTLPVPNPGDWCTQTYAAQLLGVTPRTVQRMMADRVLTPYHVMGAERAILWLPEVRGVVEARRMIKPSKG